MVRLSSILRNCAQFLGDLGRDTSGNALMVIAASLLPLLGMVGGGLDIGRGYLVQSRLQQACDAGVLAARKRLGTEAAITGEMPPSTADVGDRFFKTNFRDASYGTTTRQFTMTLEPDFAISGVAEAQMPTTIMGVFGQEFIEVSAKCSAQINSSNTDIMMVLDTTGSMGVTNPGDDKSRIESLKDVVRNFHAQMTAASQAGTRVRFGFVPYSTNVNVGHLLKDEWVVPAWGYQSRVLEQSSLGTKTTTTNPVAVSGTKSNPSVVETYNAHWSGSRLYCPIRPSDTVSETLTLQSESSQTVTGPPPGTKTTKQYQRTRSGDSFLASLDGNQCIVSKTTYNAYVDRYNEITEPSYNSAGKWIYDRFYYDVSNWRSQTKGCIEERQTYEIKDYDNVDFNRALDLNLDLIPTDNPAGAGVDVDEKLKIKLPTGIDVIDTLLGGEDDDDDSSSGSSKITLPSGSVTKWRPIYSDRTYIRQLEWDGNGTMKDSKKVTDKDYVSSAVLGFDVCPGPARKLATMSASDLNTYLDLLQHNGATYHDIGMIWGGRLMSPTGLFASENADVSATAPTSRNLIFLTDGETATLDINYSSYGIEPLDQRRWTPKSKLSLTETVEQRFGVACDEVKKRGITVWVIGFSITLNDIMKDCAGEGHYFEAANAAELNSTFATIATKVSELRITD